MNYKYTNLQKAQVEKCVLCFIPKNKRGFSSRFEVSNIFKCIPIANGGILSGNHNDLYQIIPQYGSMIDHLRRCGIVVTNSIQNADKIFDFKKLRRAIRRRKMVSNSVENKRNRKGNKNERTFAWIDSFRTLLVRFDTLDETWLNWHYLVFALILLKV